MENREEEGRFHEGNHVGYLFPGGKFVFCEPAEG